MNLLRSAALASTLTIPAILHAQPAATSLGTLTDTSPTYATPDLTIPAFSIPAGQIVWFTFTLPYGAIAADQVFLDINAFCDPVLDLEIGLYNSAGARVRNDDDDGPGLFPQLAFGDTAPHGSRPLAGQTNPIIPLGQDGDLPGGFYYLAVSGYNAAFGEAGWDVTTNSTENVSNVTIEFRFAPSPGAAALLGLGGLVAARRKR